MVNHCIYSTVRVIWDMWFFSRKSETACKHACIMHRETDLEFLWFFFFYCFLFSKFQICLCSIHKSCSYICMTCVRDVFLKKKKTRKKAPNAFAKSIDPGQPAQFAQAVLGRYFLLLVQFLHSQGAAYLTVRQKGFLFINNHYYVTTHLVSCMTEILQTLFLRDPSSFTSFTFFFISVQAINFNLKN